MSQLQIPMDYMSARSAFLETAKSAGAETSHLPIQARGPADEELHIDIARLGPPNARHVLLHTSGLHGVEGFVGSAIQTQLLKEKPGLAEGRALYLVHGINPYGMAWFRRVNENNVDLNRNFLVEGEAYKGSSDVYRKIDPLLNPNRPPRLDLFYLRMLLCIYRLGLNALKQAIAEGQFDFPNGLFFGGKELEEGPALLLPWLKGRLKESRHVISVDVHMGLGEFGQECLLVTAEPGSRTSDTLRTWLGNRMFSLDPEEGVAYRARGCFQEALEYVLPCASCVSITQEFGTYSPMKIVSILREENLWHQHGERANLKHRSKNRMLNAFCPPDKGWRSGVLQCGRELVDFLLDRAFRENYSQIITTRPVKQRLPRVSQRFRSGRMKSMR